MDGSTEVKVCPRTMVLTGRAGNGKSSTANSILGFKAFVSKASSGGLFDYSVGSECISQEILKCIGFAKNEIHAVLLVHSIRGRFTEEEEAAIQTLQTLFGPKITDYMIVVFTGGDDLEEDQTLDDYFGQECPKPLQKILEVCKNRCVMFDNKTNDEKRKEMQLQKLMTLVENVIEKNGGHPYTNEVFVEYKEAAMLQQKKEEAERTEQMKKSHVELLKEVTEMVEAKFKVTNEILTKQWTEAKSASEKASSDAQFEAAKAARKIRELTEMMENKEMADRRRRKEDEMKRMEASRQAQWDAADVLSRKRYSNAELMKQLTDANEARVKAEKAECVARTKLECLDRFESLERKSS